MRKLLLFATLSLITVLATMILTPLTYPVEADFYVYNDNWNGFSKLMNKYNGIPIFTRIDHALTRIDPSSSVLILLTNKPLSMNEIYSLREYVLRGGLLIVLSDATPTSVNVTNTLLSFLNIGFRVNGSIVLDPFKCYKSQHLPKAHAVTSQWPISNLSEDVVLNYATVIELKSRRANEIILLATYNTSYLDINRNGLYDIGEPRGSFPVAVMVYYGNGIVIVVSDESIWVNSMLEFNGNKYFLENIVSGRKLYIDQYHLEKSVAEILEERIRTLISLVLSPPFNIMILTAIFLTILVVIGRYGVISGKGTS